MSTAAYKGKITKQFLYQSRFFSGRMYWPHESTVDMQLDLNEKLCS